MANDLKLIRSGGLLSIARLQVQATPPLKPTREQILDLILELVPFQEIAVKTRTSLSTVYAVNVSYMEQHMRQAAALRLQAGPAEIERAKEVEAEVWSEYSTARRAA